MGSAIILNLQLRLRLNNINEAVNSKSLSVRQIKNNQRTDKRALKECIIKLPNKKRFTTK